MSALVLPFEQVSMRDVETVGGKNASLGELIGALTRLGVKVPGGFATTAAAYRALLARDGLDLRIRDELAPLDIDDIARLTETGARIRGWIMDAPLPPGLEQAVLECYGGLGADVAVAVRSSATAEDLPDASFAGQQETFLNVQGGPAVIAAMRKVFASLFNDRAIAYRVHQGYDHSQVALSAGIQHMVRSDLGASGVMFTLDTDSGFRDAVFITASWGLGETIVQGAVNPDEFYLYKPALRAGRRAVLRRNLGAKAIKMVYGELTTNELVKQLVYFYFQIYSLLIMEIFDDSWVNEYESLEKNYDIFYKETVENVKLFYIYVDRNKNIEHLHQSDVILSNGILTKEKLLDLIKSNKTKNGIRYTLKNLLKYNISLEPSSIQDFLSDKLNDTYINPINFLEDIYFEKTINFLQDLNSLYFILCEKENKNQNKNQNKNERYNNTTKKIILLNKNRKTRRKIT